ncbi:alkanesulfonate monooxygenase SsuD/methylene tetrahydromethanopterin reductase-like flavin-dependent oxidoreductase (luciferase family) [Rhodococcus sp. OK519]|uniref:LLM class flavin-dependent oxidoreductase n=1 Tax=Rhodococcus sp. OK519 TaxID=2135729 RepID=UPI000D382BAE|nr:alkanesulfonate monooxygenase SsuD/methylene tetrahydromethanopterin reductase-like flavin-dependent oxidoreductase (luciferase family) [Rhodococcus sp. OK519]
MKLGMFLDMRNPAPWRRPWADHYRQTLDRVAWAEKLGADSVWMTEHHFFDDGYLPQPLTLAASIAARTERIRIGTAILLAPHRHPIHIAEEAALVDLISNGRLELGLGAGWSTDEFEAFGSDYGKRYTATDSVFDTVRSLLSDGGVTPGPVQTPVPMWLGYQGPKGAMRAGRLGAGLLTLDPNLMAPYRAGLEEGGHGTDAARTGGVLDIIVADDPESTVRRLIPHLAHQQATYRRQRGSECSAEDLEVELTAAFDTGGSVPGLTVATPSAAAAEIRRRTADMPVEHVYLWASLGGMPDDIVDRHLELLFTVVRSELAGDA